MFLTAMRVRETSCPGLRRCTIAAAGTMHKILMDVRVPCVVVVRMFVRTVVIMLVGMLAMCVIVMRVRMVRFSVIGVIVAVMSVRMMCGVVKRVVVMMCLRCAPALRQQEDSHTQDEQPGGQTQNRE